MEIKIQSGDTGDRTRGLSHAKRTRYHCAISPDIKILPNKLFYHETFIFSRTWQLALQTKHGRIPFFDICF